MFSLNRTSGRKLVAGGAIAALAILGLGAPTVASATTAQPHPAASVPAKPTIVLVHGAWADGSSFAPITALLQHDGYTVRVAPNPLRGLASDAAYLAAFVKQSVTGP